MLAGFDVKKSEIHGMSQRGGSVVSHVRYGSRVFSPIVPEGEGDVLFGFELLETYRYLGLLKEGATVIANDLCIPPPSVLSGKENYPERLAERISALYPGFVLVDGLKLATEAGNPRAANTALLGTVSKRLDIPEECWIKAIEKLVPRKAFEVNMKAFQAGRNL
jgi:indolepyruvate ferredoxin oxidoreductase beta subunit